MDFYDLTLLRGTAGCACTMLYGTVTIPFDMAWSLHVQTEQLRLSVRKNKQEIRHLILRRAPVDFGGLYLAKQAKSAAGEAHNICSSSGWSGKGFALKYEPFTLNSR